MPTLSSPDATPNAWRRAWTAGLRPLGALRPPSLCAVCHGWGRRRICETCLERYAPAVPRCRSCALPMAIGEVACADCRIRPLPLASVCAAVDYDHPWDGVITRFKFHGALDLAPALAGLMLLARDRAGGSPPSVLVPMPLSAERLRERGYNQAWELARRIGRATGAPTRARGLLRIRDTAHQLELAPSERAMNVQGAFAVHPGCLRSLDGASVTLVDDVMTTGATLGEAARVLSAAGAADVHAWVVARTPRPDPP